MAKELENIANVTSVGDLPQKMEEAENAKAEVEAKILERVRNHTNHNLPRVFTCLISERSAGGSVRRMGAMREENERCKKLDRKDENFFRISAK